MFIPLEQCSFRVRLVASQLRVQGTQRRGCRRRSCPSVYELRSTLDQGNPVGKFNTNVRLWHTLDKIQPEWNRKHINTGVPLTTVET